MDNGNEGFASGVSNPLGQYTDKPNRLLIISLLAIIVGVMAGVVAYLFYYLIGFLTNLFFFHRFSLQFISPAGSHIGLWLIMVPVIGGLVVGVMAKYGTPKIVGHGIPEAMEAVLFENSRISLRVAILKPLSAAIAIGTGGPFGAEGPIIQTGAALGSLCGQFVSTTPVERRTLLACGASAGMAAIFNTPIAAVIMVIELLVLEFKARSFIPIVISSAIGATMHILLLGTNPIFDFSTTDFGMPAQIPFYLLLGLLCGVAAVVFSKSLYWFEDRMASIPVNPIWLPAIGALGLGVIGYFHPMILGVGYDIITSILRNHYAVSILVAIAVFKSLALLISLGSGTSGGLLAPMFMASSAMGALYAIGMDRLVPIAHLAPGAYALVAMGAVFGAAARSPFAFMMFAFEITRDYNAILPLMIVCSIAEAVSRAWMENSIMTEKLARRGLNIPQSGYETDLLMNITVGEVMDRRVLTIPKEMSIDEISRRISTRDHITTGHQAFCIEDEKNEICGIITVGDIFQAMNSENANKITVMDAGSKDVFTCTPNETLYVAVKRMVEHGIGRLVVVEANNPRRIVGYLGRSCVFEARRRRFNSEYVMESGYRKKRT